MISTPKLPLKRCHMCGTELDTASFSRYSDSADGLQRECKECRKARSRTPQRRKYENGRYKTNPAPVVYYQLMRRKSLSELSKQDFCRWYDAQEKICKYCGIPEELALQKYAHRLSVDRSDSSRGYALDNIGLACQACNFVKSKYLTEEEMHDVARRYIRPKWSGVPFKDYHERLRDQLQAVVRSATEQEIYNAMQLLAELDEKAVQP